MTDRTCGPAALSPPTRHLVAVGVIRRRGGRTLTFTATQAGVTGRITGAGVAR